VGERLAGGSGQSLIGFEIYFFPQALNLPRSKISWEL